MTDTANPPVPATPGRLRVMLRRHPTILWGSGILGLVLLLAVLAPVAFTADPRQVFPLDRLKPPTGAHWFGTDMLGRDIYSRTVYGARISLIVGFSVAACSVAAGLAIGLVAGSNRWADAVLMRILDGVMSIPAVLLAIALMAVSGAGIGNVILALTVAETPGVARLVRGVVLSLREQPFIEAAVASGSRYGSILLRHMLPNTVAPLLVQGTYVCAAAMLLEAVLSFIGAGTPPDVPSWGNMMAEGRAYFAIAPQIILFPGLLLSLTVLAVNLIGDGLRDALDPRLARQH
ncbi:ABC transporter permease [Primorskyibacter flagellatus]|uniref:ABC transporter permease n=1 Tax=Primorskyibacter flagellatus TaxID=1387277 RepID=A0A917AES3_9RHOB|nr:ABC transporter permease [Primorskyibacter flagellatus]GGE46934.1 ABC transporter permease [Primorskyibacter flagellatus]